MKAIVLSLLLTTAASAQQIADLAPCYRQRNSRGSCGHASTKMHLNWLQQYDKGSQWWATYRGGEFFGRHLSRLEKHNIKYIATSDGDTELLEYAIKSRRGAVVYHPAWHITNFVGRVERDGRLYACILDNNTPGRIDLHPWEQWVRSWQRISGCAYVALEGSPPPEVPQI